MRSCTLICMFLAIWFSGRSVSAVDDPKPVLKVSVDDLASGKAVVIGRLGIPLMTTVTVRGTWHRPAPLSKSYDPWFHVDEVDGKALGNPIRFHLALVNISTDHREQSRGKFLKPRDGETWQLIAHESGRFHPEPDPTMQAAAWMEGRFTTELSGVLRTPDTERDESERRERIIRVEKGSR